MKTPRLQGNSRSRSRGPGILQDAMLTLHDLLQFETLPRRPKCTPWSAELQTKFGMPWPTRIPQTTKPWRAMLAASSAWTNAYAELGGSRRDHQLPPKTQGFRLCQLQQQEHIQDSWTFQLPGGLYHLRNEAAASQRAYASTVLVQATRPDPVLTILDNGLYVLPLHPQDELPVFPSMTKRRYCLPTREKDRPRGAWRPLSR